MTIPGPIVQPGLPLKESAWSEDGTISESLLRIATWALPSSTGVLPNGLGKPDAHFRSADARADNHANGLVVEPLRHTFAAPVKRACADPPAAA